MQIYEKAVCLVKSETMQYAANGKTYAIFDAAANRKIIADLRNAEAGVILFPPLVAAKSDLDETATKILETLIDFDWLIFSDVLAVEFALEILQENDFDLYELDELRVCALGEAVSDALRFSSIHSDIITSGINATAVFSELVEYVGESEIDDLRFLYLTGEADQNDSVGKLRAARREVAELKVYEINKTENSELAKQKTLLIGGAIDEFILTAPTDLIALENYFKVKNLADVFAETVVSATDGVTLQTARERGLWRGGLFRLDKVVKVN